MSDTESDKIVLTPTKKARMSTTLVMERTHKSADSSKVLHVAGGEHKGIIINKEISESSANDETPAHIELQFKVYLQDKAKHETLLTQEIRTLKFWYSPGMSEAEEMRNGHEFFKELIRPDDFPKDYVGFIKKIMKMMQQKFLSVRKIEVEMTRLEDFAEPPKTYSGDASNLVRVGSVKLLSGRPPIPSHSYEKQDHSGEENGPEKLNSSGSELSLASSAKEPVSICSSVSLNYPHGSRSNISDTPDPTQETEPISLTSAVSIEGDNVDGKHRKSSLNRKRISRSMSPGARVLSSVTVRRSPSPESPLSAADRQSRASSIASKQSARSKSPVHVSTTVTVPKQKKVSQPKSLKILTTIMPTEPGNLIMGRSKSLRILTTVEPENDKGDELWKTGSFRILTTVSSKKPAGSEAHPKVKAARSTSMPSLHDRKPLSLSPVLNDVDQKTVETQTTDTLKRRKPATKPKPFHLVSNKESRDKRTRESGAPVQEIKKKLDENSKKGLDSFRPNEENINDVKSENLKLTHEEDENLLILNADTVLDKPKMEEQIKEVIEDRKKTAGKTTQEEDLTEEPIVVATKVKPTGPLDDNPWSGGVSPTCVPLTKQHQKPPEQMSKEELDALVGEIEEKGEILTKPKQTYEKDLENLINILEGTSQPEPYPVFTPTPTVPKVQEVDHCKSDIQKNPSICDNGFVEEPVCIAQSVTPLGPINDDPWAGGVSPDQLPHQKEIAPSLSVEEEHKTLSDIEAEIEKQIVEGSKIENGKRGSLPEESEAHESESELKSQSEEAISYDKNDLNVTDKRESNILAILDTSTNDVPHQNETEQINDSHIREALFDSDSVSLEEWKMYAKLKGLHSDDDSRPPAKPICQNIFEESNIAEEQLDEFSPQVTNEDQLKDTDTDLSKEKYDSLNKTSASTSESLRKEKIQNWLDQLPKRSSYSASLPRKHGAADKEEGESRRSSCSTTGVLRSVSQQSLSDQTHDSTLNDISVSLTSSAHTLADNESITSVEESCPSLPSLRSHQQESSGSTLSPTSASAHSSVISLPPLAATSETLETEPVLDDAYPSQPHIRAAHDGKDGDDTDTVTPTTTPVHAMFVKSKGEKQLQGVEATIPPLLSTEENLSAEPATDNSTLQ